MPPVSKSIRNAIDQITDLAQRQNLLFSYDDVQQGLDEIVENTSQSLLQQYYAAPTSESGAELVAQLDNLIRYSDSVNSQAQPFTYLQARLKQVDTFLAKPIQADSFQTALELIIFFHTQFESLNTSGMKPELKALLPEIKMQLLSIKEQMEMTLEIDKFLSQQDEQLYVSEIDSGLDVRPENPNLDNEGAEWNSLENNDLLGTWGTNFNTTEEGQFDSEEDDDINKEEVAFEVDEVPNRELLQEAYATLSILSLEPANKSEQINVRQLLDEHLQNKVDSYLKQGEIILLFYQKLLNRKEWQNALFHHQVKLVPSLSNLEQSDNGYNNLSTGSIFFSSKSEVDSIARTNNEALSCQIVAGDENCFALTCGQVEQNVVSNPENLLSITQAVAENLVHIAKHYSDADRLKQDLKSIFAQQKLIAVGQMVDKDSLPSITAAVVKTFRQEDGKLRVIAASLGNSLVFAWNPKNNAITRILDAKKYNKKPISITAYAYFDDTLQVTDVNLAVGNIFIAFAVVNDNLLHITYNKTDIKNGQSVQEIEVKTTLAGNLFKELASGDNVPNSEDVRDFLVSKLMPRNNKSNNDYTSSNNISVASTQNESSSSSSFAKYPSSPTSIFNYKSRENSAFEDEGVVRRLSFGDNGPSAYQNFPEHMFGNQGSLNKESDIGLVVYEPKAVSEHECYQQLYLLFQGKKSSHIELEIDLDSFLAFLLNKQVMHGIDIGNNFTGKMKAYFRQAPDANAKIQDFNKKIQFYKIFRMVSAINYLSENQGSNPIQLLNEIWKLSSLLSQEEISINQAGYVILCRQEEKTLQLFPKTIDVLSQLRHAVDSIKKLFIPADPTLIKIKDFFSIELDNAGKSLKCILDQIIEKGLEPAIQNQRAAQENIFKMQILNYMLVQLLQRLKLRLSKEEQAQWNELPPVEAPDYLVAVKELSVNRQADPKMILEYADAMESNSSSVFASRAGFSPYEQYQFYSYLALLDEQFDLTFSILVNLEKFLPSSPKVVEYNRNIFDEYRQIFSAKFDELLQNISLEKLIQVQPKELNNIAWKTAEELMKRYRSDYSPEEYAALISQVDSIKSAAVSYEGKNKVLTALPEAIAAFSRYSQPLVEELNLEQENWEVNPNEINKNIKDKEDLEEFLNVLRVISTYLTDIRDYLQRIDATGQLRTVQKLSSTLKFQIEHSLKQDEIEFPYILKATVGNQYPEGYEGKVVEVALDFLNAQMPILSRYLTESIQKNSQESQKLKLMHSYLKQNLTDYLNPKPENQSGKQGIDNWKNLLFIPNTKPMHVLRKAAYDTIQHQSQPVVREQRFAQRDFPEAATFSGTTYLSVKQPLEPISGTSSDAIASSGDCFAVTDGCGYSPDPIVYGRIKRVAGALAKNLVRVASSYTDPDRYKAYLPEIFFAQKKIARGKIEDELYMQYATGCLVKTFTLSNGSVRVIIGSMGDGVVLAIHPITKHVTILAEARQYGTQPKPINLDQEDFREYTKHLQITDTILPEGSIVLAFTDGVLSLFETEIQSSNMEIISAYHRIVPTVESVQNIFEELFKKSSHPSPEVIRTFLLKKLVEQAELARQSLSLEKMQQIREMIIAFAAKQQNQADEVIAQDGETVKQLLGNFSIADILEVLDPEQEEVTKLFLDSAEFGPQRYSSKGSLLTLYESTFIPHAGDDASLMVTILGNYPSVSKREELLDKSDEFSEKWNEMLRSLKQLAGKKITILNLLSVSRQVSGIIDLWSENRRDEAFFMKEENILDETSQLLIGSLIFGRKQAEEFLNKMAGNNLLFLRKDPAYLYEKTDEDLQYFSVYVLNRCVQDESDKFTHAKDQIKFHFIILEIVKIIRKMEARLPKNFTSKFSELLTAPIQEFLIGLKRLSEERLEAIQRGESIDQLEDRGQSSSQAEQKRAILSSAELEFFYTTLIRLDIVQEASLETAFIQFNEWTKVQEQKAEMSLRR